jgi:AcrR family transcriptional regulator
MKKAAGPEKASLTRDRVLRAALDLADSEGIETLSMRRLGGRLGVEAMSLYNHVEGKEDVLDGILDLVIGEIAVPEAGADWRKAMRERAVSARQAFRRHPWAAALMDSRTSSGSGRLRYFDALVGALTGAGFTLERAGRALSVLDCWIYGFALQRRNMASGGQERAEDRAGALRDSASTETFPNLARMIEWTMEHGYDEDADFEFGLNLILDGLAGILESGRG